MTREKFITHQPVATPKRSRISMIISNILLLAGSLVIVSLLIYLLFNLDKSDSLVTQMMPFFFTGIVLIIASQLIYPFLFKLRR
jgi:ABC-type siderophore export system fused ATPase/permease subunit